MSNKKKDLGDKKLPDSSFNLLIHILPAQILPYIKLSRFDRPVGIWLLMWPAWWSLSLSLNLENEIYGVYLYFLFFLGAIIMRGAGCTLNDLIDKNLDLKVTRTAQRPLPSKEISIFKTLIWLAIQCLIGFLILIQFNIITIYYGIASLALIVIYPYMKRITWWPQLFLGLAFNYGVILAWVEIHYSISIICILLYLSGIFWTIGYDTIYALMDIKDDKTAGIKSSAIYIGQDNIKPFLFIIYAIALALILLCSILVNTNWVFWPIFLIGASQLFWQVYTLDAKSNDDCLKKFKSNNLFGLIIFSCFLFGN